ncbi:MAG TPA: PRC-barrel domain-containing protein [Clostridia bacterium]|nr:PRC-barrel domain-containing protein [Clostridia bacterium]
MAHYGTLRDFRFREDVDDIRGADLYGRGDEKLGEIKDVIFDHHSGEIRYAVVDTGGWLSTRTFLVPAERIHSRASHEDDFAVDLTREQVERFPHFDEKSMNNERDWKDYESRYQQAWTSGPVLHKEGSDRTITPEADEMLAGRRGGGKDLGNVDLTPDRLAGVFPDAAPGAGKTRMRPSGISSRAEDTKLPGQSFNNQADTGWRKRDAALENARLREDSDVGFGDIDRTRVPDINAEQLPPSYRETREQMNDEIDLHRPYPVQQGRHRRFETFENHLRRNQVDVTASCRSCDVEKNKAA